VSVSPWLGALPTIAVAAATHACDDTAASSSGGDGGGGDGATGGIDTDADAAAQVRVFLVKLAELTSAAGAYTRPLFGST
jgi:hypothetical protein